MKKTFTLPVLKKLTDICSIAGIEEVFVLKIGQSEITLSTISVVKKKFLPEYQSLNSFTIKCSETYPTSGSSRQDIEEIIEAFALKNVISDLYCIILIDDYKYHLVSIPIEVEDNDIWLSENYQKFLPPSLVLDDFIFAFEKLFSDENSVFYELMIVRKEFLKQYCDILEFRKINVLGAIPSLYYFGTLFTEKTETPVVLINIELSRIQYLFKEDSKIIRNEFHLVNNDLSQEKSRTSELQSRLRDIKQLISSGDSGSSSSYNPVVITLTEEETILTDIIRTEFFGTDLNDAHKRKFLFGENLRTLLPIRDFLSNPAVSVNLYTSGNYSETREKLEKQYATKLFLGAGLLVFLILLILNLFFTVFSHLNDSLSEQLAETTEITRMVESLKNENKLLETETMSLKNLQYHSEDISMILYRVSGGIPSDCVLSSLNIKHEKERKYSLRLTGFAFSQESLARFLSNLENRYGIEQIHLLDSHLADEATWQKADAAYSGKDIPSTIFQFTIDFVYAPTH